MKEKEAKFWQQIRMPLRSMGDVDRIESHATALGRPDVNICLHGGTVWDIELKFTDDMTNSFRPAQRMWNFKRRRVGGNTGVLTKWEMNNDVLYLWNTNIPDGNQILDWEKYADVCWETSINWAQYEEMLRAKERR